MQTFKEYENSKKKLINTIAFFLMSLFMETSIWTIIWFFHHLHSVLLKIIRSKVLWWIQLNFQFKNYAFSIPTVIIQNVGKPIDFSFAWLKTNWYLITFSNSLKTYKICGSNQRTALKASVYKQSIKNLVSRRHLIVSLKASISFWTS